MPDKFGEMKEYKGKELINIQSRAENPDARILSNLANTPFEYGGYNFKCVEAALQGIKFKDKKRREEVFAMSGREALRAGREITNSIKDNEERVIYWEGKEIIYNSDEHRDLLAEFIRAKIRQNKDVQKSLLKLLKKNFIYHYVGEESQHTSLPEKFYMKVLIEEGRRLQREQEAKAELQNIRIKVSEYINEVYKTGISQDEFKIIFKEAFDLSDDKIAELFDNDNPSARLRISELKKGLKQINKGKQERICKILAIIGIAYLKKNNIEAQLVNLKQDVETPDSWGIKTAYGKFSPYEDRVEFALRNHS